MGRRRQRDDTPPEPTAIPGDPNETESVPEAAKRMGIHPGVLYKLIGWDAVPGAYQGSNGRWCIPKGAWPELNKFARIQDSGLLKTHPRTKDYMTIKEYAEKYGFHPNYVWMICDGRYAPRITIPGMKKVGKSWLIPKGYKHKAKNASKAALESRRAYQRDLRRRGYVHSKDVKKICGIAHKVVNRACEEGIIEGAIKYHGGWWIPKDSELIKDPMFLQRNLKDGRRGDRYWALHSGSKKIMKGMYRKGMSINEIARFFECSRTTVSGYVKK